MRPVDSSLIAAAVAFAAWSGTAVAQTTSPAEVVARNESAAVADLRIIISGEAAYQSANGGWYDKLECLHKPATCIPGYPADGPTFLDGALASLKDKDGYRRKFHAKAPSGGTSMPNKDESPSSLELYAVTMVPITLGKTGQRGFCGDADGVICFTKDGSEPRLVDGRCPAFEQVGKPAGCEPVR